MSARSRRLGGDTRGRVVDRHATETRGIGSGRGRRQHSLSLGLLERLCLRGTDGQRRRQDAERGAEEGPVDREEEGDGRSGQNVYRARARAPVDVLRTTVSTAPCKHASCEARPPHGVTCVAVERSASRPVPARGDGGHVRGRCGGERGARCASGRDGAGRRRAEVVHGAHDGHRFSVSAPQMGSKDGRCLEGERRERPLSPRGAETAEHTRRTLVETSESGRAEKRRPRRCADANGSSPSCESATGEGS